MQQSMYSNRPGLWPAKALKYLNIHAIAVGDMN